MSSYYPSFKYLGINSRDKRLVVAHFDADQGETDTFLGMEPIYTESADGSRRLDYGAKYNNVAVFRITVIKEDGGDFSVKEVREHLRWLTGYKKNSPLDLCENFIEEFAGDGITYDFNFVNTCDHVVRVYVDGVLLNDNQWALNHTKNTIKLVDTPISGAIIKVAYSKIKYSFIGRITNAWQYKLDARTSGLVFEFTSISPWAYSSRQAISEFIVGAKTVIVNNDTDDLYGYTPVNVKFTDCGTQLLGEPYSTRYEFASVATDAYALTNVYMQLEAGTEYTFSVGLIELLEGSATEATVFIYDYDTGTGMGGIDNGRKNFVIGQHTRQSYTFTTPETGNYTLIIHNGPRGNCVGNRIAWNALKLEKGNRATPWKVQLLEEQYSRRYEFATAATHDYTSITIYTFLETNTEYTFSTGLIELLEGAATMATVNVYNNTNQTSYAKRNFTIGTYERQSFTFTVPSSGEYRILIYNGCAGACAGNRIAWNRLQLEKGNTATDWSATSECPDGRLKITNQTTGETTLITNIGANETISMNDNMIITSDNSAKIFGNTFNFVFPRIIAGKNILDIESTGNILFEYVYAVKIGDCAMDINVLSDPICSDTGEIILTDTLPFGRISDLPDNFQAYNIQNVYSKSDVDRLIANIQINESVQINEDELNAMLKEELS